MHVTTEQSYHCDEAAYWEALFDVAGRTRRELEGCDSVAFEVLHQRRQNGVVEKLVEHFRKDAAYFNAHRPADDDPA
jgi:hypothetical protein